MIFLSIRLTQRAGFLHAESMLFSRGESRSHTESPEALEAPEDPEDPETPDVSDNPDNPDNLDAPEPPLEGKVTNCKFRA